MKEEQLINITNLCEFLDEIFFVIQNVSNRAIESLNKSAACAILNYITNNLMYDEVYSIMKNLLQKYIKREYFVSTAICF